MGCMPCWTRFSRALSASILCPVRVSCSKVAKDASWFVPTMACKPLVVMLLCSRRLPCSKRERASLTEPSARMAILSRAFCSYVMVSSLAIFSK